MSAIRGPTGLEVVASLPAVVAVYYVVCISPTLPRTRKIVQGLHGRLFKRRVALQLMMSDQEQLEQNPTGSVEHHNTISTLSLDPKPATSFQDDVFGHDLTTPPTPNEQEHPVPPVSCFRAVQSTSATPLLPSILFLRAGAFDCRSEHTSRPLLVICLGVLKVCMESNKTKCADIAALLGDIGAAKGIADRHVCRTSTELLHGSRQASESWGSSMPVPYGL
ncbi:hypothetical protein PG997_013731 [Apiospora hydei]|uniref:Uncharacterized protein n=1 Tax=Apiospora hydei TaxID=1337664 RepID=A0ABR1V707_9PEZI